MKDSKSTSVDTLVRQTWLHYYNDYLRDRKIITEEEWRKLRRLIEGKATRDA